MVRWRARGLLPLVTFVTLVMILGEHAPRLHLLPSFRAAAPGVLGLRSLVSAWLLAGSSLSVARASLGEAAECRACFYLAAQVPENCQFPR